MAGRTLYDKIWQSHSVGTLPTGQTQLFIGLHLIHEITTAPAFDMLREKGMDVRVSRTHLCDHRSHRADGPSQTTVSRSRKPKS